VCALGLFQKLRFCLLASLLGSIPCLCHKVYCCQCDMSYSSPIIYSCRPHAPCADVFPPLGFHACRSRSTWRRALVLYEWLKASNKSLDDRLCTTVSCFCICKICVVQRRCSKVSYTCRLVAHTVRHITLSCVQIHTRTHAHTQTHMHLPCSQLIRVCADHSDAVSALSVYEWMRAPKSAGGAALRPTTYTYTAAMRAALGANMLDRALQVCVCVLFLGGMELMWHSKQ